MSAPDDPASVTLAAIRADIEKAVDAYALDKAASFADVTSIPAVTSWHAWHLLAAVEAALKRADEWEARARQLDAQADAADGQITVRSERRTAVTLSARAGVHDKCALELRAAIRATLAGEEASDG